MSDTATQGTPATDDASAGNPDIRALRQAAEDGKTARTEATALKKELLFAKAGIDTESRLGKLLFASWESDDVVELKTEWAELNPTAAPAAGETPPPPKAPEQTPTPPGFQDPQGQQEHRDNTQGGQPATGDQLGDKDPVDAAMELFWGQKGRPMDDRQIDALGHFVGAFVKGDPRTRFDAKAWAQKQIIDSADDLDAP